MKSIGEEMQPARLFSEKWWPGILRWLQTKSAWMCQAAAPNNRNRSRPDPCASRTVIWLDGNSAPEGDFFWMLHQEKQCQEAPMSFILRNLRQLERWITWWGEENEKQGWQHPRIGSTEDNCAAALASLYACEEPADLIVAAAPTMNWWDQLFDWEMDTNGC